jgi:esterase/lipase superfamily enzyme
MEVAIFGRGGHPLLAFPGDGGNAWSLEFHGVVHTLADYLHDGRLQLFCVSTVDADAFLARHRDPSERSRQQRLYDQYVRTEVLTLISRTAAPGHAIATMGLGLGAYHAVNTLLKQPDVVKCCWGVSGIYQVDRFMDNTFDEDFYFNNPLHYVQNLTDTRLLALLGSCSVKLVTAAGCTRSVDDSYLMADVLRSRGVPCSLDDWGASDLGDWDLWRQQLRHHLGQFAVEGEM